MKKTIKKSTATKSKTVVKSHAKPKTKVSASKKNVAAKKVVKRKGVIHHFKRAYHLTPKFVHGAIAGAFVGIMLVTSLGISGGASANPAAAACISTPGGFAVNNANVNVDVKLTTPNCGNPCQDGTHAFCRTFVLKAYYAPDATAGKPQQLVKTTAPVTVKTTDKATTHMNVFFDTSCYFQVDLVDITNPKTADGYPIPLAKTAGTHDCRVEPPHSVACGSLALTPGSNRSVTITNFAVTTQNADFTAAVINWGDTQVSPRTTSVLNAQHVYSADGTYDVTVTPYFTYHDRNNEVVNGSATACVARVTYTPIPETSNPISVCEISTKTVISIDEKKFGNVDYPSSNYTTDLTKCASIPPPETPSTPLPPSTLAKTGPGAVLVVLAMAVVGGTLFHKGHRHIKHRRQARSS